MPGVLDNELSLPVLVECLTIACSDNRTFFSSSLSNFFPFNSAKSSVSDFFAVLTKILAIIGDSLEIEDVKERITSDFISLTALVLASRSANLLKVEFGGTNLNSELGPVDGNRPPGPYRLTDGLSMEYFFLLFLSN
ncbi:hypothetical protein BpHYR1_043640 [Brachionus plicatilis]|uniref:Uncharacterized protein n=1 Tax=Brachionus plicatilis TaxID=10195 RepID=A0A3M7RLK3_BRAPC|nr:hypothetical protein BpHYR1_043640 [Brachionus plicatilis]